MLEAAWQTADPWHLSLTFRTARWAVMPHWFFDQASGTDLAMGLPPARTHGATAARNIDREDERSAGVRRPRLGSL
jgi:hypothetical protein